MTRDASPAVEAILQVTATATWQGRARMEQPWKMEGKRENWSTILSELVVQRFLGERERRRGRGEGGGGDIPSGTCTLVYGAVLSMK